jgi:hypothetical protein
VNAPVAINTALRKAEMLFYARVLITPFVLVELGIVAWYLLYWDLFPKYSIRRLVPWSLLILSAIGIPLLQIYTYRIITMEAAVNDVFVHLVIFSESVASAAFGFYLLLKRRSQKPGSE